MIIVSVSREIKVLYVIMLKPIITYKGQIAPLSMNFMEVTKDNGTSKFSYFDIHYLQMS